MDKEHDKDNATDKPKNNVTTKITTIIAVFPFPAWDTMDAEPVCEPVLPVIAAPPVVPKVDEVRVSLMPEVGVLVKLRSSSLRGRGLCMASM